MHLLHKLKARVQNLTTQIGLHLIQFLKCVYYLLVLLLRGGSDM